MPADKLHITLAGREHVVEAGTTAGEALAAQLVRQAATPMARDRGPGQRRAARPGVPAGRRRRGRAGRLGSADGLAILRHPTAHVLAQAVQELYPEAKLGIGPPIENGFYYDFDVAAAVQPRGS